MKDETWTKISCIVAWLLMVSFVLEGDILMGYILMVTYVTTIKMAVEVDKIKLTKNEMS